MTVKEIEIIITAKVEEAIKAVKKIEPTITKMVKNAQGILQRIDTKLFVEKISKAVQLAKRKVESLKKSNKENQMKIRVNNSDAEKQISQVQKEINSLQRKINSRQIKLNIAEDTINKIRESTKQEVRNEMPGASEKIVNQETNNRLNNNSNYKSLIKDRSKINDEIVKHNSLLETAKLEEAELSNKTQETGKSQNKVTNLFSTFKEKLESGKASIANIKEKFGKVPEIAKSITNHIKGMSKGLVHGIGSIIKFVGNFVSLSKIYSVLSNSAQTWLSSQNSGAMQLSANIEYMKYAMGSAFASGIQYAVNMVYQLMKAIQSVIYALFKVNIFANASAKSYSAMAGNAKKAKEETKQLTGVHSEINNIQSNKSSDSNGEGGVGPSFDLAEIDSKMNPLAQRLYDFFKPLKESWDNYGENLIQQLKITASQIGGVIASVCGSFEKIITNGTVYTSLEMILAIIGNIAESFANAWNNNGNGDAIVQNLADAFNNLLECINYIVASELFQVLLNGVVEAFKIVTESIEFVTEKLSEFIGYFGEENQEKLDGWAIIIGSIATAIVLVSIAIGLATNAWNIYTTAQTIANDAAKAFQFIAIVGLVALVVAALVWISQNWDEVSEALIAGWEWIKQKAGEIFSAIKDSISNAFNTVRDTVTNIWNGIVNTISNVWNTIVSKVREGVLGAWNAITSVFGNTSNWFRDKFSQAWQAVKNVFSAGGQIFDGIKDGILNGLKVIINAIIRGINRVISIPFNGINSALRSIRDANIMGVKPFSWISTIAVPQIPELATGNVAYSKTLAIFGEYVGASTNPEITTPQNIMAETFRDVLSDYSLGNNSEKPIYLTVKVGDRKIGDILLQDLRDRKRQAGKDLEALVGG